MQSTFVSFHAARGPRPTTLGTAALSYSDQP